MNRRVFMLMFGAAVGAASVCVAETYADQVVRQLVAQGYANIQVEATLLGRLRIKGTNGQGLREIILNPKTGEILRDMWLDADGNPILAQLPNAGLGDSGGADNFGSGSGSDDNSGTGSDDSSGPGSGGGDVKDAAAEDDARDDAEDAADDAEDARDDRDDREREDD